MAVDDIVGQLSRITQYSAQLSDNYNRMHEHATRTESNLVDEYAARLRECGFRGDISADVGPRVVDSTDNSVYELRPALILWPRDAGDIRLLSAVAAQEQFRPLTFAPRGGGTGTNGQSLSNAIVVDTSRHMNRILEIDLERKRVRVEPGVVLGQLNAALAEHGLFFPPHTSTASRATIGGMVGTDACGKGSRCYGRTGDYVETVSLSLPDGRALVLGHLSADRLALPRTPEEVLARSLRDIVSPHRDAIRTQFPEMSRSLTGYNLRDAFPDSGDVNIARLVAGAEGTLGFISEVVLRVIEQPRYQTLVVVRYREFDAALRDANRLLAAQPTAVETLDQRIIELARQDSIWPQVRPALSGDGGDSEVLVTNFLEFRDSDPEALAQTVARFVADLDHRSDHAGYYVSTDPAEISRLWSVRAKSVGMLGRMPGRRKPVPFVEDTVVPPEYLADYIRDFTALLRRHGVDYAMFGHVDVGCLHIRPALDLSDPADEALLRVLSDEVVALVKRYRGLLWGEHGKGVRGEYTRDFFGDELYGVLAKVKQSFDPDNRMNPGKIVAPDADPARVFRIDAVPLRAHYDRAVPRTVRDEWDGAFSCNGNGACFEWDHAQTICPSYKVTRDRVHSPKGRAMLLREWLRQREAGSDAEPTVMEATFDAMMGCLACRACATQCPVHVNIPALRTPFLEAYYQGRRRPRRDYVLAGIEHALPLLVRVRTIANAALRSTFGQRLTARLGLTALPLLPARMPKLAPNTLRPRSQSALRRACRTATNPVVIVTDAFSYFLDPAITAATTQVMAASGATPILMPYRPSGKALHVQGFARRFSHVARANADRLHAIAELGVPLVAIEPAVTVALNADYAEAIGDRGYRVQALSEWLAAHGPRKPNARGGAYRLALHCTEKSNRPASAEEWRGCFAVAGLSLDVVATGCCGMAGAYGHIAEHEANSKGLFELSWSEHVTADDERPLLATGYSCRSQSQRFADRRPPHPIEVLAAQLAQ